MDFEVQFDKMEKLLYDNQILRQEITREVLRSRKYLATTAPTFKFRLREETKLSDQITSLKTQIAEQEEEILKIKKSQRYTNYQELRIMVEELEEEMHRLKKLNKKMKQEKYGIN